MRFCRIGFSFCSISKNNHIYRAQALFILVMAPTIITQTARHLALSCIPVLVQHSSGLSERDVYLKMTYYCLKRGHEVVEGPH